MDAPIWILLTTALCLLRLHWMRAGAGAGARRFRPLRLAGRAGRMRPLLAVAVAVLALAAVALSQPGTLARPDGAGSPSPSFTKPPAYTQPPTWTQSHAATQSGTSNGTAGQPPAGSATGGVAVGTGGSATSGTTRTSGSGGTGVTASTVPAAPGDAGAPGGRMRVHFLDVGQGSATLFEIGDRVLLIDGGGRDRASFVVAYLQKLGIRQVDAMVATHYDEDHLNGLVGVLNVFPVRQVYDVKYGADTRVFQSFKQVIQAKRIPEQVPGMKQTIQLGGASVTFVAPREYGHREENDDSICVRVVFGQTSFLIMGDPSANAEQQILTQNLESDVFLASHHGSDGSNSRTLLDRVKPDYAVISCGDGNPYGHPGRNTLGRLKATGARLFRTDRQGTLVCTSDGSALAWNQSPGNDFTPGTAGAIPTAGPAPTASPAAHPPTTMRPTAAATAPVPSDSAQPYVLNTSTKKFHFPSCGSAAQISDRNRKDVTMTREAVLALGYAPCGNCDP